VNHIYMARSSGIAARKLGGEMIIMSAKDSTLFTLNEVAAAIWEAANGLTPLAEIVQQEICPQFDVDPVVALSDAESFVQELARHGVLLVSNQPLTDGAAKDPAAPPRRPPEATR
jgi:phosphohistidine swiveling domain-containing protein